MKPTMRSYRITSRAPELGGGWKLTLLEDDEEAGGGVFPVATDDAFLLAEAYDDAMCQGEDWIGTSQVI